MEIGGEFEAHGGKGEEFEVEGGGGWAKRRWAEGSDLTLEKKKKKKMGPPPPNATVTPPKGWRLLPPYRRVAKKKKKKKKKRAMGLTSLWTFGKLFGDHHEETPMNKTGFVCFLMSKRRQNRCGCGGRRDEAEAAAGRVEWRQL